MGQVRLFLGRAWRNVNRRVSRLYLGAQKKKGSMKLQRLGSPANGWYAPANFKPGYRCYCIGVGLDASYDFAMAERGAEVHSFDPTPSAIDYMSRKNPGNIYFHPWAALDKDGTMRLYFPMSDTHGSYFAEDLHNTGRYHEVPCYRLETIMQRLGHDTVDLIKMDIEGSWFSVLKDIPRSKIRPTILEVEYDSPAPIWRVARVHSILRSIGYTLIHRERDNAVYELRKA